MRAGAEHAVPQPETPGRPGTRVSGSRRRLLVRGRDQHGPLRQRTPGASYGPRKRGAGNASLSSMHKGRGLARAPGSRCLRRGRRWRQGAGRGGAGSVCRSDAQPWPLVHRAGELGARPGQESEFLHWSSLEGSNVGPSWRTTAPEACRWIEASAVLLDALARRVSSSITCH